jgi:hypothetical protein
VVLVGAAALAGGVYALGGAWRFGAHFALTHLCHGVSAGKVMWLLVFTALVGAALVVRGGAAEARAASADGGSRGAMSGFTGRALIVVLTAGSIASLAGCVAYMRGLGLPSDWASYHWRDGVNSVNSLEHVHTSKAGLAMLLDALGAPASWHERFDTGSVYVGWVPAWTGWTGAVCFVLAAGLVVAMAPRVIARCAGGARMARAAVLAVAGCGVSKSMLDGGPLAYDFVVCATALTAVVRGWGMPGWEMSGPRSRGPDGVLRVRREMVAALVVWTAWVVALEVLQTGAVRVQVERAAGLGSLLGLGLMIGAGGSVTGKRTSHVRLVMWGVLGVGAAVMVVGRLNAWVRPMLAPAPARVVEHDHDSGTAAVEEGGGRNVLGAYLDAGESPFRVRGVAMGALGPGVAGVVYAEVWVLRTDDGRVRLGPVAGAAASITRSEVVHGAREGVLKVRVRGELGEPTSPAVVDQEARGGVADNDRFIAYLMLDGALRRAGVREYVIVPYTFAHERTGGQTGDGAGDGAGTGG